MGITERKWTVHEPGNPEKVGRLATELGVDRVLAELLVQRGVETFEQARRFFRPSLDDLHDPFLMKDMDKAVERLHEAITKGQKILVYGDYDALMKSLRDKLLVLPGDTDVLPGHGHPTSVAREAASNPFLLPFNEPDTDWSNQDGLFIDGI